jgi:hypothetical protein
MKPVTTWPIELGLQRWLGARAQVSDFRAALLRVAADMYHAKIVLASLKAVLLFD